MEIAVCHGVGETVLLGFAFPPFASLQGEVSVFLEQFHNGGFRGEAIGHDLLEFPVEGSSFFCAFRHERIVSADPHFVRVEAGGEAGEGGATEWSGDVTAFVEKTRSSEFVEVRRLDLLVPHEAIVGPPLIIAEKEDDIGLLGFVRVSGERAAEDC